MIRKKKKHRRASFRCGEDAVDRWLKTRARQAKDKRLSVTRVLLDEDGVIAGYYTPAMGLVHFDELPGYPLKLMLPWSLLDAIMRGGTR